MEVIVIFERPGSDRDNVALKKDYMLITYQTFQMVKFQNFACGQIIIIFENLSFSILYCRPDRRKSVPKSLSTLH